MKIFKPKRLLENGQIKTFFTFVSTNDTDKAFSVQNSGDIESAAAIVTVITSNLQSFIFLFPPNCKML